MLGTADIERIKVRPPGVNTLCVVRVGMFMLIIIIGGILRGQTVQEQQEAKHITSSVHALEFSLDDCFVDDIEAHDEQERQTVKDCIL